MRSVAASLATRGLRALLGVISLGPGKSLAKMAAYLRNYIQSQPSSATIGGIEQMRKPLLLLAFASACTPTAQTDERLARFGLPTSVQQADGQQRQSSIEVFVKSNHPALIADIRAGGGQTLTEAMDRARIPQADRATRIIQLQGSLGVYESSPGALVAALSAYGL